MLVVVSMALALGLYSVFFNPLSGEVRARYKGGRRRLAGWLKTHARRLVVIAVIAVVVLGLVIAGVRFGGAIAGRGRASIPGRALDPEGAPPVPAEPAAGGEAGPRSEDAGLQPVGEQPPQESDLGEDRFEEPPQGSEAQFPPEGLTTEGAMSDATLPAGPATESSGDAGPELPQSLSVTPDFLPPAESATQSRLAPLQGGDTGARAPARRAGTDDWGFTTTD